MNRARDLSVVFAVSILALTAVACDRLGSQRESPLVTERTAAPATSPEELGRIGARLEERPDAAEEILQAEGLTWVDFAEAVRSVAADSELASRYEEGFREESARLEGAETG